MDDLLDILRKNRPLALLLIPIAIALIWIVLSATVPGLYEHCFKPDAPNDPDGQSLFFSSIKESCAHQGRMVVGVINFIFGWALGISTVVAVLINVLFWRRESRPHY